MKSFRAKHKRKINFIKLFGEGLKEGWKAEWNSCQWQTGLKYKINKNVRAREFKTQEDADKFATQLNKRGYGWKNIFINPEYISFSGIACPSYRPQKIHIVYYSRKKLNLEPNPITMKQEIKTYAHILQPRLHKPTKKDVEKTRKEVGSFLVKSSKLSKEPVCSPF
jgi:hypothetical protein